MNDGENLPRPLPPIAAVPTIAAPTTATEQLAAAMQTLSPATRTEGEETARRQIASLEREARALGPDTAAALLFHEIGLLWEDSLNNPRNAAVAYQNAFRLAPKFLANIRAARRLFSEVGNWQMVVQLLDAELAATEDERQRAALLFERGTVLEEHLSREEEAAAAFAKCLELSPRDVSVLVQLESAYATTNQYSSLVQVYRLLALALDEDVARAYYLTAAGLLLENRLNLPEEAAASYREAFKLNRRDPVLLAAMVRTAERSGHGEELIVALAAQAQVEGASAANTYIQISKAYGKLGLQDEALSALLEARSQAPNDALLLAELAFTYDERGMHEELADVLLARAELSQDDSDFAGINLRLAALYEDVLKQDEEAVGRYRAVLARVPQHADALARLGRLYHRTRNWDGLLSVFDLEVAAAEDPRLKAARMYKAAEILEKHLHREEEAIARYNQCLQLQPGYLPAQQALIRLYERQGRYGDLLAMYEQEIAQTSEPEQIVSTLNKMAVIFEERLSEIDRAIDCMKRILEQAPDHLPTIRNLARMYEYSGRWRELIQVHENESAIAGDTRQVLSLHHRNAEILEEQLGDRAGAIAAYQRLLSLSPAYLPALKALGRLYSEGGNWAELVQMYRAEAEIAHSANQSAALLFRAGELVERKLGDQDQAIATYREVLELTPNYLPALRALEQIYRSRKAWEQLIEVLRAEAANRTDPGERANALLQAAGIWESQLNRQDEATTAYEEVLRLAPGHPWAIAALKRLYVAQGNLQELVTVLDREAQTGESTESRIAAHLKLAEIYLDRLNEPGRAAQACEAVVALEPTNVYALKMLERARTSDRRRTSELRLKLAEGVFDPRLRAALKLASISDGGLADEKTLQELRQAFAEDPGDPRLGPILERALRRAGEYEGLLDLYERMVELAPNPVEKLGLLFRIAEVAEHRLRQPAKAFKAYRAALELNPQLVPALQGASRTAIQLQDFGAAREALEAEGKASRDVRAALEAFVAAGRVCVEKLHDAEGAIANFRRALERDPLDSAASAALRDLLSGGRSEELASFHERAAEAKLAQKDLVAAASEFLIAARIWLEQAGDPAKALRAVERSLAAQPSSAAALEMKGRLALDAHQFGEAAAAYAARVQLGGEPEGLLPLHLKLGALYQDHLSDATRAAAHFQTVLAAQPNNLQALERLAAVHGSARNWTGASDCLKALLELETQPSALVRHSTALGKIYEEGFSNPSLACSLYRRALELAPGDLSVVGRLSDLYERTGSTSELVQMLEQQVEHGRDSKRSAALRVKIGDICAKSLGDAQKAIASYRLALKGDPECVAAHAALADLYMRDAAAAPSAIDAHRQLLRLDPARVESIHALFRLWEGLRQSDKAFCAAGLLRFMRAANEAELAYHLNGCRRVEAASLQALSDSQLDDLIHPSAKGPILEVLRAIGDQLAKQYPPDFEAMGINRRADRLKSAHPMFKTVQTLARILGVQQFEAYQSTRGWVSAEVTDPLAVCICEETVSKLAPQEQRFLIARALFAIRNRTAIANKLSSAELADLIGAAIRIFAPSLRLLGHPTDELTKQLARNCSRKTRKALESAVEGISDQMSLELDRWMDGMTFSADRAGLLVSGEVSGALGLALREETNATAERGALEPAALIRRRPRLEQLAAFALSDEHFELRAQVGIAV
jgi:tetratricopeptide (TPR) repeat protein